MSLFTFKKLTVPETNDTKEVDVIQLWEVRWISRHGEYSHHTQPELEAFTSYEKANEFATALKNANKLLRNKNNIDVRLEKSIIQL